jgi:hypothetical protein
MAKIECIIGKIVGGFVRTEYLLSQIVSELGLTKYRTHFFADYQTSQKLKRVIEKFRTSEIKNKEKFVNLIRSFDNLREQRNIIVHGLVLVNTSNEHEYKFHSYLETKEGIKDKSKIYSLNNLLEIEKEIIQIHNDLVELHFN